VCASQFIKIGHSAKIGDMVYIYDTDFHEIEPHQPVKQSAISIGNNVWICAHSMVLAGSSIGDHSIVAAGSIVTGDIPAKSLAAGTPARVIKRLNVPDNWIRN
jgi:acetyltransferase-like isoleucine patch superfamily enzyme